MKHYILYYHGGSSNHGCEALVRTTAEILDYKNNKISLASFYPDEDKKYGIDNICDIHEVNEQKTISRFHPKWLYSYFRLKLLNDYKTLEEMSILNAFGAKKRDIAISIGGDTYCYNDRDLLLQTNDFWRRNGLKTVLWGCSIEPNLLNDSQITRDLSRFDLITARESISYNALKQINKNTIQVSDSAFGLSKIEKIIPKQDVSRDFVGLNLSPLIENYEPKRGLAKANFEKLIEHIISTTDMNVLLVPHVVNRYSDDRIVNEYFYHKYKLTNRVYIVDDCNCQELKGYISNCRFFIGARTHATIAAYSCMIPTLVLGYSVKSRGIAKDIFGDDRNYVVPVQGLQTDRDIIEAFNWLCKNEQNILHVLNNTMDSYIRRINAAKVAIKRL